MLSVQPADWSAAVCIWKKDRYCLYSQNPSSLNLLMIQKHLSASRLYFYGLIQTWKLFVYKTARCQVVLHFNWTFKKLRQKGSSASGAQCNKLSTRALYLNDALRVFYCKNSVFCQSVLSPFANLLSLEHKQMLIQVSRITMFEIIKHTLPCLEERDCYRNWFITIYFLTYT